MKTRAPEFSLSALAFEVASALDVKGKKEAFDYGYTDTDAIQDHQYEKYTHKTLPNKQLDLFEIVTFNGLRGLEQIEERISFSEFIVPTKSGREKTITAIIRFLKLDDGAWIAIRDKTGKHALRFARVCKQKNTLFVESCVNELLECVLKEHGLK